MLLYGHKSGTSKHLAKIGGYVPLPCLFCGGL